MDFDPFAPVTCAGCKKPVFASEKLTALKQVWHKGCLKCTTCGLTLNTNSLESYQNTPYCKAHKPNPKHSSVKSVVDQVATNVPKAARRVQGINKSSRMTFAPGAQGAIKPEGAVRPGGGPSRGGSSAASRAGAGAAAGTGTAAAVAAAAAYDDGAYDDQSYDQQQGGYEEGGYDESYAEGEGEGYYEGEGEGEGYYEGEGEGYYEGEGEGEGYYEGEEYHEGHGY